jgi:ubiquinol-cytochrome c reductase cytochrome b subunit
MLSTIKQIIIRNRWGGQSLICLYVSVLSGIVVALQYDPATPFHSSLTIELLAPFGSFWRSMHFYSSQAFFLLLVGHFIAILWKGGYSFSRVEWIRLTASIPIGILLLFTGYVLQGGATGMAAGAIGENIALSIPIFGESLNNLFLDLQMSGMRKVYVQHIIGLMVLGGVCVWPHLKRYPAYFRNHLLMFAIIMMVSITIKAPMVPERVGITFVTGPWFFLGLQELLRYLPVFVAGVIAPMTLVIAIFFMPHEGRAKRNTIIFIIVWLIGNGYLSWRCYDRL